MSRSHPLPTLEDEGADGSRRHVLDQAGEKGLSLEVGVVLLKVLFGGMNELDVGDLVACEGGGRD